MNAHRPDQTTLERLITLGQCADGDARIGELLGALKANAYVANIHPFQDFEWLRDIPWADACAVVRAVVHLEAARLTKSGGSASAIKSAYRTMEDSDRVGAMDERGNFVDPHKIMALALRHLVEKRGMTGAVVRTVSTTRMLDRFTLHFSIGQAY